MNETLKRMEEMHKLFMNGRTAKDIVERAKQLGLETHVTDELELDLEELIYREVVLKEEISFAEKYSIIGRKYRMNPLMYDLYKELFMNKFVTEQ